MATDGKTTGAEWGWRGVSAAVGFGIGVGVGVLLAEMQQEQAAGGAKPATAPAK
jgi:hypothetical protein